MKVYGARIMEFSGLDGFDACRELYNLPRQLLIYVLRSLWKFSNFLSALSSLHGETCYKAMERVKMLGKLSKRATFHFPLAPTHTRGSLSGDFFGRASPNVIPSVVFLALTWMAAKIKRRFPQEYNRESSWWNLCGCCLLAFNNR